MILILPPSHDDKKSPLVDFYSLSLENSGAKSNSPFRIGTALAIRRVATELHIAMAVRHKTTK